MEALRKQVNRQAQHAILIAESSEDPELQRKLLAASDRLKASLDDLLARSQRKELDKVIDIDEKLTGDV